MDRVELGRLLASGSDAGRRAGEALEAGAGYEVWDSPGPQLEIASTYGRRLRHTRRTGQETVGFAEAVESIEAHSGAELVIGFVDDRPRGGYYFQLFLSSDLSEVVACLGISRR